MLTVQPQSDKQSIDRLRIMKGNSRDYFRLIYFKILYLDLRDLNTLPSTCEVTQPDLSDISHLTVTISPDEVNIKQKKDYSNFFLILIIS